MECRLWGKRFFDNMEENAKLFAITQASKNLNGTPDLYMVVGTAAGLGHTSLEDMTMMGAVLGSQGAFDDDPESVFNDSYISFEEDFNLGDGNSDLTLNNMRLSLEPGEKKSDLAEAEKIDKSSFPN